LRLPVSPPSVAQLPVDEPVFDLGQECAAADGANTSVTDLCTTPNPNLNSAPVISDNLDLQANIDNGRSRRLRGVSFISLSSPGSFSTNTTVSTRKSSISSSLFVTQAQLQRRRGRNKFVESVWKFLDQPESSKFAFCFARAMPVLVGGSVLFTLLLCMEPRPFEGLFPVMVEAAFDTLFTLEILTRFIVCPDRCAFFFSAYNYLDLVAGLPAAALRISTAITISLDNGEPAGSLLLCVVPVLRLFKMLRHFEKFRLLVSAFKLAFEALPVLLFTLTIHILVFSALIYLVEPRDNIPTLPWAVWLTVTSMTTLGYGDKVPTSGAGHVIISVLVISSSLYMAIPLGIVGNAFSRVWEDRDRLLLMSRTRDCLFQEGYNAHSIPELFHIFDADRDGQLSFSEFQRMIQEMRIGLSADRALQLFTTFDRDGNGGVDDGEFMRALFPKAFAEIYGECPEEIGPSQNKSVEQLCR